MGLKEYQIAMHDLDGKKILEYLSHCGIDRGSVEILDDSVMEVSLADYNWKKLYPNAQIDPNTVLFFYDGPEDGKTRPFCHALLQMNKFFTVEDLRILSGKLGYDVFLYEGGFNCRHRWKMARIKGQLINGILPDRPSRGAIDRASVKQPSGLQKYF